MKKIQVVNSFTLKLIALISMFIDHFSATILTYLEMTAYQGEQEQLSGWVKNLINYINNNMNNFQNIALGMRIIGRIAFPIYCFLLVQGFNYTRCKWKYALRLLIFAFISEWPFDVAFNERKYPEFRIYNNVFFTLFIGMIFIWGIEGVKKLREYLIKRNSTNIKRVGIELLYVLTLMVLMVAIYIITIICTSDYGMAGVVCIFAMYIAKKNNIVSFCLGTFLVYLITCNFLQLYAFFGLIPIIMYNGQKGKSMKWFFYIFYPAHLLLFILVSMWMGIYIV
jgi:hypothetical protein